ncbi:hypothetical protein F8M41_006240 [Gigaspora margarita]|uniref:Uncharacterized protein n=1 Tax=Gigaspora margarita TaxID=4874 RepID=A0A8H3X6S2_GIGMA|nr:hypothetical protein F8M41_006240 [Gigaspora margarita]
MAIVCLPCIPIIPNVILHKNQLSKKLFFIQNPLVDMASIIQPILSVNNFNRYDDNHAKSQITNMKVLQNEKVEEQKSSPHISLNTMMDPRDKILQIIEFQSS